MKKDRRALIVFSRGVIVDDKAVTVPVDFDHVLSGIPILFRRALHALIIMG